MKTNKVLLGVGIVGGCAGIGYFIGRHLGTTEEEKKRFAIRGMLIGAGVGAGGIVLYHYLRKNKPNTLNYSLHNKRGQRLYEGICFEHRLNKRINEHLTNGKIFETVKYDLPKPRHVALNLERSLIQKYKPKYNVQHNC